MMDLYVMDLTGQTEMLTGYKELAIKQRVNGEYSLSFILLKTDGNEHSYPLVQEESAIEYDGQEYIIKNLIENSKGDKAVKTVQAEHIFFSLIDHYIYESLVEGEYDINTLLAIVFAGSRYTCSVDGTFSTQYFESFGLDNGLSLVNLICNTFGAEIDRNNKHVTFKNQIGKIIDFQFRYRHNTKTISKSVNTTNLSTVIRGYADKSEYGIYMVETEYRSPMADVYGERHASPIYADDLVFESSLQTRLQESINDKPDLSYSLEFVELKKQGFPEETFEIGDTVFTIWEPLSIDIQTRIVEGICYPESNKSPVVTLANFKNNASDILADFGRTKENIEKILTDGGKIRFSAMEEAVKIATIALNNSLTELEYPEGMGIIARDPNDSDRYVVFRSNGIGITVDGGQTFKEAITADGFVLSAGVIGKLKADNIDATNLQAAKLNLKDEYGVPRIVADTLPGKGPVLNFLSPGGTDLGYILGSQDGIWDFVGAFGARMGFGWNQINFTVQDLQHNGYQIATQSWVQSQGYSTSSGLSTSQVQTMIDDAIATHIATDHVV